MLPVIITEHRKKNWITWSNRTVFLNCLGMLVYLSMTTYQFTGNPLALGWLDRLLVGYVLLTFLAALYLLVLTFGHWYLSQFKNRVLKIIWFLILIGGLPLILGGPLLYYLLVFEFRLFLKK